MICTHRLHAGAEGLQITASHGFPCNPCTLLCSWRFTRCTHSCPLWGLWWRTLMGRWSMEGPGRATPTLLCPLPATAWCEIGLGQPAPEVVPSSCDVRPCRSPAQRASLYEGARLLVSYCVPVFFLFFFLALLSLLFHPACSKLLLLSCAELCMMRGPGHVVFVHSLESCVVVVMQLLFQVPMMLQDVRAVQQDLGLVYIHSPALLRAHSALCRAVHAMQACFQAHVSTRAVCCCQMRHGALVSELHVVWIRSHGSALSCGQYGEAAAAASRPEGPQQASHGRCTGLYGCSAGRGLAPARSCMVRC